MRAIPPILKYLLIFIILAALGAKIWPLTHRIFNWDELGLLSRTHIWLEAGFQVEEGRPGLVKMLLMPIVALSPGHIPTLYLGRILNFMALLGIYFGVFRLGSRLYGRGAALFALFLLSFHSLFFAHSVELRTETFAMAFTLLGVSRLEGPKNTRRGDIFALILILCGALCTQKALYPLSFYLLAKAFGIGRPLRPQRRHLHLILKALGAGLIIGLIAILASDTLRLFVYNLTVRAFGEARHPFYIRWVQWTYIEWSFEREPLFWIAGWPALAFLIRRRGPYFAPRRKLALSLAQQALIGGILWFHSARFPYFFITIAPLWALATGYQLQIFCTGLHLRLARRWPAALFLCLLGGGLVYGANLQRPELFKKTAAKQLGHIRALESVFPKGTPAFDAHHLMFYHDQIATPIYSRAVHLMKNNPEGAAYFAQQIKDARPWYYIQSKRTELLPEVIQSVLSTYYIRLAPNTYIAGMRLFESGEFEILVPGSYRLQPTKRHAGEKVRPPSTRRPVIIDGKRRRFDDVFKLDAGMHSIEFKGKGAVRLRLDIPNIETIEAPNRRNWQLYRSYK